MSAKKPVKREHKHEHVLMVKSRYQHILSCVLRGCRYAEYRPVAGGKRKRYGEGSIEPSIIVEPVGLWDGMESSHERR